MLFNSLQFIVFFIVVTLAYFSLAQRGRVWLLLLASCYFYMAYKPVYILILFATIVVDYYAGIWIEQTHGRQRKYLLIVSLITNVGFLAFFKYFNFVSQNLNLLIEKTHFQSTIPYLSIILPIGLSFHTFQAMSYTIEVYRAKNKAEKDFVTYALYVMFYPQLVAGPIERPQNILWQFHQYFKFDFENLKAGIIRMLWGFFKKVVIADRLKIMVDSCYDSPASHSGMTLLVATIFFAFEIYCDFSGYSDIAIGAARVMGFDLMENFERPYFSTSISEFWKKWHISLSSWFRDYLYIPLGGNRVSEYRQYFNLFFVFMVSGLWHGAAWNFIIWGALHGIYLVIATLRDKYFRFSLPKNTIGKVTNTVFTFVLVMLTWVFFRAIGLNRALLILKKIFSLNINESVVSPLSVNEMAFCYFLIIALLFKEYYIKEISTRNNWKFYGLFLFFVLINYFLGVFSSSKFIYFQF